VEDDDAIRQLSDKNLGEVISVKDIYLQIQLERWDEDGIRRPLSRLALVEEGMAGFGQRG
jgi:hypothetical protein